MLGPDARSAWIDVHPAARGRGLGSWLRTWPVASGRQRGRLASVRRSTTGAPTRSGCCPEAGYLPRYTSWVLTMDLPERPAGSGAAGGRHDRGFRHEDETETLQMFEDAFAELPGRPPSSLATWRAMTIEREGFARTTSCSPSGRQDRGRCVPARRRRDLGRQVRGPPRLSPSRHRPGAAARGVPAFVRPRLPPYVAVHRLQTGARSPSTSASV